MKRLAPWSLLLVLLAGPASAAQYGLRGGLSFNPDQFVIGGHADLGAAVESLRLVPNIELGLGNDITLVTFNGDLIHDFPRSPWSLGGEVGLLVADHKRGGSSSDIGLSVLGNYRLGLTSGRVLTLEAKLGLVDSPDFKFTVGWSL